MNPLILHSIGLQNLFYEIAEDDMGEILDQPEYSKYASVILMEDETFEEMIEKNLQKAEGYLQKLNVQNIQMKEHKLDKILETRGQSFETITKGKKFMENIRQILDSQIWTQIDNFQKLISENEEALGEVSAEIKSIKSKNKEYDRAGFKYSNINIKIRKNDLVNEYSEAIVNPANTELNHAGGAARAISDASGPEFEEDCTKYLEENKELPTGKAMLTRAGGALCCDRVIHAVGPIYQNKADNSKEEELFKACIISILEEAKKNNIRSVSIPAISTGIFHFPLKLAVKLMAKIIRLFIDR